MRAQADLQLVFINLLVNADKEGFVDRHWRTIVDETGLPENKVKEVLKKLESPDAESRTPEQEGRRIVRIDPDRTWGWQIVNHKYYRELQSEAERREYMRDYMEKRRSCKQSVNSSKQNVKSPSISVSRSTSKEGGIVKGVDPYLLLVEELSKIISTKKNIKISQAQLTGWAKHVRRLEKTDGVDIARIKNAIVFYAEHIGEEYMPAIESGESLRRKFTKLEDAMKRMNYKMLEPPETDRTIIAYAKQAMNMKGASEEDQDRFWEKVYKNCGTSGRGRIYKAIKEQTRVLAAAKQLKTKKEDRV